ncbi:hypothetical protein [Bradyrhizobium viridifuturi]|uniref:hypothetical protein n=1 Tax=Bradyrhizobium viridifuturi TaxID=1654716 RepID=UPI000A62A65B|nr:hypothetical protein [Bradyrhizobium viridifuturi]
MSEYLIQALIEAIFTKTGRGLWGLVGVPPYEIVAMISGMIFWGLVAIFAYARMHG